MDDHEEVRPCIWQSGLFTYLFFFLFSPKVEFCGYRYDPMHALASSLLFLLRFHIHLLSCERTSWQLIQCTSSLRKPYSASDTDVRYEWLSGCYIRVALTLLPDNLSSLEALLSALDNLDNLFETIEDNFKASLTHDDYERWNETSWDNMLIPAPLCRTFNHQGHWSLLHTWTPCEIADGSTRRSYQESFAMTVEGFTNSMQLHYQHSVFMMSL